MIRKHVVALKEKGRTEMPNVLIASSECAPLSKTGGLADSVKSCQVGQEDGTGFLFNDYKVEDMLGVIHQAVQLYHGDRKGFAMVQERGMKDDFSWTRSAGDYHTIYQNL